MEKDIPASSRLYYSNLQNMSIFIPAAFRDGFRPLPEQESDKFLQQGSVPAVRISRAAPAPGRTLSPGPCAAPLLSEKCHKNTVLIVPAGLHA